MLEKKKMDEKWFCENYADIYFLKSIFERQKRKAEREAIYLKLKAASKGQEIEREKTQPKQAPALRGMPSLSHQKHTHLKRPVKKQHSRRISQGKNTTLGWRALPAKQQTKNTEKNLFCQRPTKSKKTP